MRVHLTGSSRNPADDLPYLRKIIELLHVNGASVVLNWVEAAYHKAQKTDKNASWDWDEIMTNNLDAVSRAHCVIIEGTTHGFTQGFQAAIAIERRRPVLFLSREPIANLPVSGIRSRLFTAKQYTNEADLEKILKKFLDDNAKISKPLTINEKSYLFLHGEALLAGKTESEVVEDMINERSRK